VEIPASFACSDSVGRPASPQKSYRYLPISLFSGPASPRSGLGQSTVWRFVHVKGSVLGGVAACVRSLGALPQENHVDITSVSCGTSRKT
jgi:hypothetical protein